MRHPHDFDPQQGIRHICTRSSAEPFALSRYESPKEGRTIPHDLPGLCKKCVRLGRVPRGDSERGTRPLAEQSALNPMRRADVWSPSA